jgi:phage portal protein BeeE
MKNIFNSLLSYISGKSNNGQHKAAQLGVMGGVASIDDYAYVSAQTILYADNKERYICEGYAVNDIIYSIINLILQKVKVARWGWYTVVDEKAYVEYCDLVKTMTTRNYESLKDNAPLQIKKDFKRVTELHKQALKPLNGVATSVGKLQELIKYPNQDQTWAQMVEEGCGFKLITGDKFRIADISEGPLTKGLPKEINNLASQHMIIIREADRFPYRAAAYKYQCGVIKNYTREEMLHEKYFNPVWDAVGTQLYGLSPIQAAWQRILRTNKGQIAATASYDNGGADGALWPKDKEFAEFLANQRPEILDETKARVKSAIGGGVRKRGDIAVLGSGPWEHARFRMSNVDLAIIEAEKWDMPMLCNIWQVPSQLMNDPNNKIQANAVSGEKALTLRCAWPLLCDERDSMNRKFQTSWGLKGKNVVLDFDATVFTELEEDKASMVKWLLDAYWLTPNQKLDMMGEPISDDPNMKRIWMPSSLIPMDDASVERIDPNEFLND